MEDKKTYRQKCSRTHEKYYIANIFSVDRNLVARCMKGYDLSMPAFTDYTNEQVIHILAETMELNNNFGEQYVRGMLFTNGMRIH